MADGVEIDFDVETFARDGRRIVDSYQRAAMTAVGRAGRDLTDRLNIAMRGATPGWKRKAFNGRFYPNEGTAPASIVTIGGGERTRGAVQFWSQPGTVRGSRGQFLAIPTPAAGARRGGEDLTPAEWERVNGQRLIFVSRPGRPGLLVAPELSLRPTIRRKHRSGASKVAGPNVTVIFILIRATPFRNSFAIEPLVKRGFDAMLGEFAAEISRLG